MCRCSNSGSTRNLRGETRYAKDDDLIFASEKLGGENPRCGSMLVNDYLRPPAIHAGIIGVENGTTYGGDGEVIERFGFHSHLLTSGGWQMARTHRWSGPGCAGRA